MAAAVALIAPIILLSSPSLADRDKACSACFLVSEAITEGLRALRDDTSASAATPDASAQWLRAHVGRACDGWRNIAITGAVGERVYVDMASSLGPERLATRPEANLSNVEMGPKIGEELRAHCTPLLDRVTSRVDVGAFAASARWRADLDLSRWLCRNGRAPCVRPTGGGAALRERASAGPALCDACSSLIEQLHARVFAAAEAERHTIRAGESRESSFDVGEALEAVCTPLPTRPHAHAATASPEFGRACHALRANGRLLGACARAFSGELPTAERVHAATAEVCAALDRGCEPLEPRAPAAATGECATCRLLVGDLHSALNAQRRRSDFGSARHVFAELSELCAAVPKRHARGVRAGLEEGCDELVDSHERALGDAVVSVLHSSGGRWPARTELEQRVCARVLPGECRAAGDGPDAVQGDGALAEDDGPWTAWYGKDEL